MRSIWKGSLNLKGGIFSIPVKVYSATSDEGVHFHQIHEACNSRVKRPLFCETCNRIIESSEVKKAYELSEGNHIILEKADFDAIPLSTLKEVEIVQFCKAKEIDVRAYDKSYFISAQEGGEKAFTLLLELLSNLDVVGVVQWTYREKERLAVVRQFGNVVLLQTLKYANELRDSTEVEPSIEYIPDEKTMKLMSKIVKKLVKPFRHGKFHDSYANALKEVIEIKASGGQIAKAKEAVKTVEAGDMIDALQQTLALLGDDDEPKKKKKKSIRRSGRTAGTVGLHDKPKSKKKKKQHNAKRGKARK